MRDLQFDLRRTLRILLATPGNTAIMVGILALGIAANGAVFSLVRGVLLRPLPYAEPDRLLTIYTRFEEPSGYEIPEVALSGPEYLDYRNATRTLSGVAAWNGVDFNFLAGNGEPVRVEGIRATANLFHVLGTAPFLGRGFGPGEDSPGSPCVVVLSHRLWLATSGSDGEMLGGDVRLDGVPCRVIGVMPAGFVFPSAAVQLWTQMLLDPASPTWSRASHALLGVGRLAPGATQTELESELTQVARIWEGAYPEHHVGHTLFARGLHQDLVGESRRPLLVLMGAVGLVYLAIAVNLTGLGVTRAEGRRREIALRVALGASRPRIARQLIAESVTTAVAGGLLGLLGAALLIDGLLAFYPGELPRVEAVRLDLPVALFSMALALATGFIIAGANFWSGTRSDPWGALRAASRSASAQAPSVRVRRVLVVAQVAIGLALVLAATHLVRAYARIARTGLGFDPHNVVTFAVTLPPASYPAGEQVRQFMADLTTRLETVPGVVAAGGVSDLPLESAGPPDGFMIEGRPAIRPGEAGPTARALTVTPGWFPAFRVPLIRGRLLDEGDIAGRPLVAVINQSAAKKYWPGEEPIGRRIRYYGPTDPWIEVVGVVGDLRSEAAVLAPEPAVYVAHAQIARTTELIRSMTLVVRTAGRATASGASIRAQVTALDPSLPITEMRPMTTVAAEAVGDRRFTMVLMTGFAGIALMLSALGLYGVLAYQVVLRTREIGIRMALGASHREVRRQVLGEGLAVAVAGIAIGLGASLAGQRVMAQLLFEVRPNDPLTLAGVSGGLILISIAACLIPVVRASRVDPAIALRAE